jgi:hypothetical protein
MRKKIVTIASWPWRKLIALADRLGEKVIAGADWLRYNIDEESRYLYVKRIADIMGTVGAGCLLLGSFQGYDAAIPFALLYILASVFLSGRLKK